jgi:hypothetical protein
MYTDTAVTAGDYIYMYGTGTMGSLGATVGIGQNTTFVAGSPVYGYSQNVTTAGAMYSPLYPRGTYTGTSQTTGVIKVAAFDITATNINAVHKCCTLTNGNIAMVFRQGTALWMSIYGPTGTVVLAPASISSITVPDPNNLAIAGMADGGFVVAFGTASNGYFMRFSSTGAVVKAQTSTSGTNAYLSVAAFKDNSYILFSNPDNSQLSYFIVSSANVVGPQTSVSALSTCTEQQCTTLDNGQVLLIGCLGTGTNYQSFIINSGGTITKAVASINLATSGNIQLCTVAGGAAIAYRIDSTGYPTLVTVTNAGTSLGQVTLQANPTYSPGGICAGQNGQLFITSTDGLRIFTATFSSSAAATVGTVYTISTGITGVLANTCNALNGTNYIFGYSTLGYPRLATYTNQDLTQNVTVLTGANYTPATNYYFLGVAASSAAAGGTISVVTNGNVTLPSTYPSVTSPISFDYQNGASPFAQRGTITGRTIALKGLE